MNVSLNWLNDHIDVHDYSIEELDELLTFAGVEVEKIEHKGLDSELIVVAQVQSSDKHPNADKLSVCQVDDGSGEPRQIVCGAKNYEVGDKVPLALPGTVMPGGFKIKKGKLRGVESLGMMCSARELGLSDDHEGLMILPEDAPVGAPLKELVKPDTVIEVEVTPNRPDWLSHLGVARELSALSGKPLKGKSHHRDLKSPVRPAAAEEVKIKDYDGCPVYTARIIRGIKVGPSPDWLKEKLNAIGLRPINNIVDITNYVLMEMGQPLHAFDMAKLSGGITVRRAADGEEFLALDGETYSLDSGDLVIADQQRAVAIGGVMGGEESGVTETTVDVLLESAYFDPPSIRRTSRRLGLVSDSSYRFERGIDPQQTIGASELATKLILELAGGTADKETLVCGEAPTLARTVALQTQKARALLGADIDDGEIDGILTRLGLEKSDSSDGSSDWIIPSYRLDLHRHIDLVEEIARVYGIDKIPSTRGAVFPDASAADDAYDFRLQLKSHLSCLGFHEAATIKLIAEGQVTDSLGTTATETTVYPLKNPLSDDHTVMRSSILPALLAVAERNIRMGAESLRFFEAGTVFSKADDGSPVENQTLALLMAGRSTSPSWVENHPTDLDAYDLRATLEGIVGPELRLEPAEHPLLLLAAKVQASGSMLGWAGQLPPAQGRKIDLESPVLVAELDLEALQNVHSSRTERFKEMPRFPGSSRDIAMFVPADLPNAQLEDFFASLSEPLLESYRIFDVFHESSDTQSQARKSVAYSLTYRDESGTLQSNEVDDAHGCVLEALKQALPVEIR